MSVKETEEIEYVTPCTECPAQCCGHIATQIDKPTTKKDFDHLRWFLMHDNIHVAIERDGTWLLIAITPCRHLETNQCANYDKRPKICRDYPAYDEHCEFEDKRSPYRILFNDEKELELYLIKKKMNWKYKLP